MLTLSLIITSEKTYSREVLGLAEEEFMQLVYYWPLVPLALNDKICCKQVRLFALER